MRGDAAGRAEAAFTNTLPSAIRGRSRGRAAWKPLLAAAFWLALLLLAVYRFDLLEAPLVRAFGSKQALRERAPLWESMLQHVSLVLRSTSLSAALGLLLGMAVRLRAFAEFRAPLLGAATFLQTVPSAAILALSVPVLGYGQTPVLIALVFYGLLPVLRNTARGLDSVPRDALDAAAGMGMTPMQALLRVRWPLALPAVISGIRTSAIINISAATLGATVGAGGLGVLIVNGIRAMDPVMIIKGALPVSLLALLASSLFTALERAQAWRG
ncbi:MAG TPA: ABC transporter permease [Candidatus Limnocylindria bacterium]|nr:ABC transporter permease [Candidatus Limnocylindria bacterium]